MMNIVHNEKHIKRYRKKYHFMKFKVKSLIIENAALCDEVAKIQENIQIVKDERKFLLRKLLEYENDADIVHTFYTNEQIAMSNGTRSKPKKRRSVEDGGKNVTMG
nr:transforming growth factor beta regulator 1 [Maniola hyperantus]